MTNDFKTLQISEIYHFEVCFYWLKDSMFNSLNYDVGLNNVFKKVYFVRAAF